MQYHRAFCAGCKGYTVHFLTDDAPCKLRCIHCEGLTAREKYLEFVKEREALLE